MHAMNALPSPWSPLLPVALIVGLLAVLPSGLLGQPTLRAASPHATTAPTFVPEWPVTESREVVMLTAPAGSVSPRGNHVVAGGIFAGAGSVAGALAGGLSGMFLAAAGGSNDEFSGLLPGVVIGSWFGAAVGSTTVGGDFGKSLVGSAVGMVLGLGVMKVTGDAGDAGPVPFALTHGFTTALFGF